MPSYRGPSVGKPVLQSAASVSLKRTAIWCHTSSRVTQGKEGENKCCRTLYTSAANKFYRARVTIASVKSTGLSLRFVRQHRALTGATFPPFWETLHTAAAQLEGQVHLSFLLFLHRLAEEARTNAFANKSKIIKPEHTIAAAKVILKKSRG
ncbi:centromere protein W [Athene cunicularia]|uniref:centromere protein W n=1 Tax=Athene cunicularia TaxID=194338 RepID=UPI000EF7206A|nr:centromere protein W [Athene cunicularia]